MSVFETTIEVLERLSVKNSKTVMVLPDAERKLKAICSIVDNVISEFDAETYTVSVVPEELVLEISVLVPEMIIEDCAGHDLFKLIDLVDSFGFATENENISLDMRVNDLFYIAR